MLHTKIKSRPNNLNRPITPKELETVIKSLPAKEMPGQIVSVKNSFQRRYNTNNPQIALHNINRRHIAKFFLWGHSYSDIQTKNDATKKENYRPSSLMNIDTKICNKILANRIQDHINKIQSPWSSRLHPRDAGMIQHMKICQCNPPYKQTKKPLTKFNTPSW